jgi:hypothetical protein
MQAFAASWAFVVHCSCALPPAARPLLTRLCLAVCLAGLAQVVANVTFGELARRLEKEGVVVLAFYAGEGCVAERAVDGWVGGDVTQPTLE